MAIDPQYNVELTADELSSQIPTSILYGVSPSDKFIPIRIDSEGRFLIGTDVTLTVDDVDLNIRALDPEDSNASRNLSVKNLGSGNGFALRSAIFSGGNQLAVQSDGSIDVNVVSSGSVTDTDDGSVASGQTLPLNLNILYGYNGVTWERLGSSSNRLLVDGSGVTQPVSGTVTANQGTSPWVVSGSLAVTQSGVWNITDITGTVSLPTGASTEATLATRATEATLAAINTKLVSGTVIGDVNAIQQGVWSIRSQDGLGNLLASETADPLGTERGLIVRNIPSGVQPISASSLPLPTGAATETTLSSLLTEATFTSRINTLGQKTMANSTPVVLASDQSNVPIVLKDGSGTNLTSTLVGAKQSLDVYLAGGVPVETDITDDVTRELGRILASDFVIPQDSHTTTSNVYSNARPIEGDINVRRYKTKKIYVSNTSANNGRLRMWGSVDNGANFDVVVVADSALNNGVTSITNLEDALTHIRIEVRSQSNGQSTTFVSKGYALGV